jgi:hypothetical protein
VSFGCRGRACSQITGGGHVPQPRGIPVDFQRRLGLGERQLTATHHLPQDLVGLDFLVEAGTGGGCRPVAARSADRARTGTMALVSAPPGTSS